MRILVLFLALVSSAGFIRGQESTTISEVRVTGDVEAPGNASQTIPPRETGGADVEGVTETGSTPDVGTSLPESSSTSGSTDLGTPSEGRYHLSTTDEPSATYASTESTTSETTTEEEEISFIQILDPDKKEEQKTGRPGLEEADGASTLAPSHASHPQKTRKERLSDQIRAVIAHYKKFGTVTIPGASIPDPMDIPNMKKNMGGSDITFSNTKVYGLSNFTIEHINTDLDKMQVYVAIYVRRLVILGNYTAKMFFRKVAGPFNATLLYVEASGAAALVRDEKGNLQASDSEMDMTFMDSKVKFGNMGLMGTLLQGVVASAGPILFESIKPFLLTEINNKVRADANTKIKAIGTKFTQSGNKPPLDIALEEGRKYVRENGYDPYYIDNYILDYVPKNQTVLNVTISRLTLIGLSNFRRVGEVSLSMDSGTVQMGVHLATSKLRGKCYWSFSLGRFVKTGHTNFTVDYVQGRGVVNQSLDVSQPPTLQDLDINVGKVKIQMRGTGPFDFILETVINTLPDIIRHMIVDALELPLKYTLQNLLSEIRVEDLLEKQLPELDKMGL